MYDSELITNDDGSIYHLALQPEQLADIVLTVGDPERVNLVTRYFDRVEFTVRRREFETQTGWIGNKRITCMSTGMGSGNIDIVLNELDALANIDFQHRTHRQIHKSLQIIRIGTSGSISDRVDVDEVIVSDLAIGLEGIMLWYKQKDRTEEEDRWHDVLTTLNLPVDPYVSVADSELRSAFDKKFSGGVTLTTAGFYAPQSRTLRLQPTEDAFLSKLRKLEIGGKVVTNIEMETAAIYGLSNALGHRAISVNAILANRLTGNFSISPKKTVDRAIQDTLEVIVDI